MILNIADEVTVPTEAPTFPISQWAWPTAYFTSITVLASHLLNGQSVPPIRRLQMFYYAISLIGFLGKQLT